MAADGTRRITWHGKDFAATTEIVKLGEIETSVQVPAVDDPWLRRFIAALVAWERIEGASRIVAAHVIEMAACRWLEQGGTIESWQRYETELGVTKSKTRSPRSFIQPVMRWGLGGKPDTDGRIARLSAAFDAWLTEKDRPDPYPRNGEPGTSELAEWLRRQGGYQEVAKPHNTKLEYEPSSNEYLTPPEFHAELDREFNFTRGFDPCPYPRPKGFDGLKVPWPESTYCNSPFRKQDGIGIAAFARKAIEENKLGKTVVLVLPTFGTINCLLEAGAELRSARRINWIDPRTGKPAITSPSSNMLAILRGTAHSKENEIAALKARIAELEAENVKLKAQVQELTGASDIVLPLRRKVS